MIVERAPAKLNLALHVRARRPDGYHELETVFAFATDGDAVTVARDEAPSFAVTGPFAAALAGEGDNLVLRAVRAFAARFGGSEAYRIVLDKRLPVASGLGGGSADAAATLRALARLNGVSIDDPGLMAIATGLGADVPACLLSRAAVGRGRGEQLAPLPGWGGVPLLLVNPGVAVSTAAVFAGWDGQDRGPLPDAEDFASGRNDLTPPALRLAPVIGEVITRLAAAPGCTLARMSGSGATCFGLFASVEVRDAAEATLRAEAPDWWTLATGLA